MTATHSSKLATISSTQVAVQAPPALPSGRPPDILTMPFDVVDSGCNTSAAASASGFTYVDVFAGTSAWSEGASLFGGAPAGFIEKDSANRELLRHFYPSSWICADYYDKEWKQYPSSEVDVIVAWPMCNHLSMAGRRRMQRDVCATQLWDICEAVDHFRPLLVGVENVIQLEEDESKHGLMSIAIHQFDLIGYTLSSVWRLNDPDLGGYSERPRAWLVFEPTKTSSLLSIFYQPSMSLLHGTLRDCLAPVDQVSSLKVHGSVRGAWFQFSWAEELQPGTVVLV